MAHDFKKFPELTNAQMQVYYFESPHKQITEDFRAHVEKVHDGDTITVTCDFRDFKFPIRLAKINAPELNEPEGRNSKYWLKDQIEGQDVDVLINKKNRVGKYGRLIGIILFNGSNLNDEALTLRTAAAFGTEDFVPDFNKDIRRNIWLSA